MAAAVADFRPAEAERGQDRPPGSGSFELRLEETEDILAAVAARRTQGQVLVGFAAEHGSDAIERAAAKLERKGLDAIVFNDVSRSDIGFDSERNEVTIVERDGRARRLARGQGRGRRGDPRPGRCPSRSRGAIAVDRAPETESAGQDRRRRATSYGLYRRGMELLEDGDFEQATVPLAEGGAAGRPRRARSARRSAAPTSAYRQFAEAADGVRGRRRALSRQRLRAFLPRPGAEPQRARPERARRHLALAVQPAPRARRLPPLPRPHSRRVLTPDRPLGAGAGPAGEPRLGRGRRRARSPRSGPGSWCCSGSRGGRRGERRPPRRQGAGAAGLRRRRGADERAARRARDPLREPVHPLRRHPQGQPAQLRRGGAAGGRRAALRALLRAGSAPGAATFGARMAVELVNEAR